jgi:hypothetical protein
MLTLTCMLLLFVGACGDDKKEEIVVHEEHYPREVRVTRVEPVYTVERHHHHIHRDDDDDDDDDWDHDHDDDDD